MQLSSLLAPFSGADLERFLGAALARGGDYADLFFERREEALMALEDGGIRSAARGAVAGVGVRVLSGERTGYAYTEECTAESILAAARAAAVVADGGAGPESISVSAGRKHDLYDAAAELVRGAPSERAELLLRADAVARAIDPRVRAVMANISESVRSMALVSSTGVMVEDVQPMVSMRVSCIARDGDVRTTGTDGAGGRRGLDLLTGDVPEQLARQAAEQAVRNLAARPAPAGAHPVVLGNAYSGILLHEAVGHGLEADFNRKGFSRYSGQIGERVASPLVTVIDDGTMRDERGSINVDDEGNPSGHSVLIDKGVLVGYLHDRLSARLMDTPATGNGRRESYKHVPLPRMTNTLMPAGSHDPEEIIRSVKRGIYAVRFGGGQVEIGKGDFVFATTEAYLIEDGKVTAPLRDVTLIGNGPEVMSRVDMVGTDYRTSEGMWTCGKDGQSVPVGVGMPTIKISSMTVGGTGE